MQSESHSVESETNVPSQVVNQHHLAPLATSKLSEPTCSLLKRTLLRNALNILPLISGGQDKDCGAEGRCSTGVKQLNLGRSQRQQDRPHRHRRTVAEPDHKFLNCATLLPTEIESFSHLQVRHSQDIIPAKVGRRHSSDMVPYSQRLKLASGPDWLSILEEELGEHMQLSLPHFSFGKANKLASITL